jgi:hypothetical protein
MRILEGEGVTKYFGGLAAVSHVQKRRPEVSALCPSGRHSFHLLSLYSVMRA